VSRQSRTAPRAGRGSSRGVDLTGAWRAHLSEPDLAKTFAESGYDDGEWESVSVPHHWRSEPLFADSDGPVLYRRRFVARTERESEGAGPDDGVPGERRRWFLELDGVFYYGDVWLDGEYLGATEGYFARHAFEVTDALRAREDHLLAIEVTSPPQRDRSAKRTITGGYWQSPVFDRGLNPGGIWGPVRIASSGPVRIARAGVLCVDASVERGRVACNVTLDAATETREAHLHAVVRGPAGVVLLDAWRTATLAAGTNELAWTLTVEEPPRWWPRTLGPQTTCTLELDVEVDGIESDGLTRRFAFRDVRRRGAAFLVNGERIFMKGASYAPARALPGEADASLLRADVRRAVDANLDFLRVHTHVAPAAFYDAADEAGLLLWQDLPMEGGYARGVRRQAARQARAMVELLGAHPSIVVWCAHDAPLGDDAPARAIANATVPTWGKEVLDRSTARAIARTDGTRPVVRSSGAGDDSHLWFGWRHGTLAGVGPAIRAVPRLGRFVSAFGAQSVPSTSAWMQPNSWPDLDWDALAEHHGMERRAFAVHVPATDAKSFDEWADATQAYQAALLQLQIEDLRRCKGTPCGGFAVFCLADPSPAVGFGLLDHERVEKRAYAAVRDACRPLLAMVDPRTGHVHVVNDTRNPMTDAAVVVAVDGRTRQWRGDIEADAVVFIGSADLDDAVDVEVVLTHPDAGRIANRYPLLILEAGRRT
jgi:beta-mannosidase